VTDRQPTALILEDLHWADEMSIRLLAFISRRLQARRLLVLVTAREEELIDAPMLHRTLGELERESDVTRVTLGPLSRSDTLDLVAVLSRPGSDGATAARLGRGVARQRRKSLGRGRGDAGCHPARALPRARGAAPP
jgi:hypothetical protein